MTPIQAHVHVPEKPGNEASHLLKIYYPWAGNEARDVFNPRPPPCLATVQSSKAQRRCGWRGDWKALGCLRFNRSPSPFLPKVVPLTQAYMLLGYGWIVKCHTCPQNMFEDPLYQKLMSPVKYSGFMSPGQSVGLLKNISIMYNVNTPESGIYTILVHAIQYLRMVGTTTKRGFSLSFPPMLYKCPPSAVKNLLRFLSPCL